MMAPGQLVTQLRLMAVTPPGREAPRLSIAPQQLSNYEAGHSSVLLPGGPRACHLSKRNTELFTCSAILDSRGHGIGIYDGSISWHGLYMSSSRLGHTYVLLPGHARIVINTFLAGSKKFEVAEMEVFLC